MDLDAIDAIAELDNKSEATLDLFARFLGFVAGSLHADAQSTVDGLSPRFWQGRVLGGWSANRD